MGGGGGGGGGGSFTPLARPPSVCSVHSAGVPTRHIAPTALPHRTTLCTSIVAFLAAALRRGVGYSTRVADNDGGHGRTGGRLHPVAEDGSDASTVPVPEDAQLQLACLRTLYSVFRRIMPPLRRYGGDGGGGGGGGRGGDACANAAQLRAEYIRQRNTFLVSLWPQVCAAFALLASC